MTDLEWVSPFFVWGAAALAGWGVQFVWYAWMFFISPRKYLQ